MTRQYSEDEHKEKIELAKNDILFRVSVDTRLDSIEDSLSRLVESHNKRKGDCAKAWREDILWFVGVPASVLSAVFMSIRLFKG